MRLCFFFVFSIRIFSAFSVTFSCILFRYFDDPDEITPRLVRKALKRLNLRTKSRQNKFLLLEYIISHTKNPDLSGIPLLPLADGEFIKFQSHKHISNPSKSVFVPHGNCTASLLPNLQSRFLDENIPTEVRSKLSSMCSNSIQSKKSTQLIYLTKEIVVETLRSSLPLEWLGSPAKEKVSWTPGKYNHPPEKWLEMIWNWIHSSYPYTLMQFEGLPLVPVQTSGPQKYLGVLSKYSKFIFASDGYARNLPLPVTRFLTSCGCTVLSQVPPYLHHQGISSFIFPPTPAGVLALLNLVKLKTVQENIVKHCSPSSARKVFHAFMSLLAEISDTERSLLLQLPLFDTLHGTCTAALVKNQQLIAVSSSFSFPKGFRLSQGNKIISYADTSTKKLLSLMNVTIVNQAQIFACYLFPDVRMNTIYSDEETDLIMEWILNRIVSLASNSEGFLEHLKDLPFVPTESRKRKRAMELYDLNDLVLCNLFAGQPDAFPTGTFARQNMITTLVQHLGLRTRNMLTATDLYRSAEAIASSRVSPLSIQKVKALVEILNGNPDLLNQPIYFNVTLKEKLSDLSWIPCCTKPPIGYPDFMPWPRKTVLHTPSKIRSLSRALVIGSSMPTLGVEMNLILQNKFGLMQEPPLVHVVNQLKVAITSWRNSQERKTAIIVSKFQEMLRQIYLHLSKIPSQSHVIAAFTQASLNEWIWQGEDFCSPKQIALRKDFALDLRPQLFLLPKEFKDDESLVTFFLQHDVQSSFSEGDILEVLGAVRKKHTKFLADGKSLNEVEKDLELCRAILQWVVKDGNKLSEELQKKVFVPVQSQRNVLVLEPCKKCTYYDRDWFRRGGSELVVDEGYHVIHDTVSEEVARLLGVAALSTVILSAESCGFEQAGPHESITNRLRNVLKDYKDGVGVLKELIQNADDAGASKVSILVDRRHGPKEKLLSSDMKECQGPALWAYNDAVFSDKDFENINKLAGATKVEDLAKIGRFGLGFSAVYHLTDVPSFVSGKYFAIFDPNVNHLKNHIHDSSRPGIRINLATNPRPLSAFEDQFQPYHNIFGCCTKVGKKSFNYKGTLFRFPFRTSREANNSKICQTVYKEENIKFIVNSLKNSAELLLLFTEHVKQVELYEIQKGCDPKNMNLLLSIAKDVLIVLPEETNLSTRPFTEDCVNWWLEKSTSPFQVESPSRSEVLTINVTAAPSTLTDVREKSVKQEKWLSSTCVGTGSSFRLASKKSNKHSLLPLGGAAARLSVTPSSPMSRAVHGEAFCFLPLSIPTGLQVHVNAYFAVTSNRRNIWEQITSDYPVEVQWNECLMEDALCNAYLQLLEKMKILSEDGKLLQYTFHELWPRFDTLNSMIWENLVKSFYKKLVEEDLLLLQSHGRWLSIHDGYLLDKTMCTTNKDISLEVTESLELLGERVFQLPTEIHASLEKSGQHKILRQRTLDLKTYFEKFFFPNLAEIPQRIRVPIVCHGLDCILNGQEELSSRFQSYPCITCSEDGRHLAKPGELVNPKGAAAKLFSSEDRRFPVGEHFLTKNREFVLEQLGMVKDELSWDDICERAKSVEKLSAQRFKDGKDRVKNLIKYLKENMKNLPSERRKASRVLQSTKFLPVMVKPCENYALPWKGSEYRVDQLFAPKDLFLSSDSHLVGSSNLIANTSDAGCGKLNQSVKHLLGFTERRAEVVQVLQQLDVTIEVWSGVSEGKDKEKRKHTVESVCKCVYKYLDALVLRTMNNKQSQKKNPGEKEKQDEIVVKHLVEKLSNKKWLFTQEQFVSSEKVACYWTGNASPFLYSLPQEYSDQYSHLLEITGVKQSFDVTDFVNALNALQKSKKGDSLNKEELKVTVSLLNELKEVDEDSLKSHVGQLPLPSTNLVLFPCNELTVYSDEVVASGDISYVHDDILPKLALKLGAKSLKNRTLDEYTSDQGVPYGQYEDLTDRLKNILKSYPCDCGILKELVQNADDAQATEIHFIYDARVLPDDKTLQKNAKEVQGPALCVYNNRPFSNKDLQGITKLGVGNKGDDPEKTGQFGIGFNAVYHLTDCPSFLSNNDTLCFLDPHLRYIPKATVKCPGGKYQKIDENFKTNFKDVYLGYLEDKGFDLSGATMFRLPLRTLERAKESLISNTYPSDYKIGSLLSTFQSEAKKMLLFLNHVRKISISKINKDGKLQRSYEVISVMDGEIIQKRQEISALMKTYKNTPTLEIPWKGSTYPLTLSSSTGISEKWLVHQCLGAVPADDNVPPDGRKYGLFPRGGIAALVSTSDTSSCVTGQSYIAYCFLPLPVKTLLPVHVNGHFALDSSRRDLWRDGELDGPLTRWNNFLKSRVLVPAYAALICEAQSYIPCCETNFDDNNFPSNFSCVRNGVEWYHNLFPRLSCDPAWKLLVTGLYRYLGTMKKALFPVVVTDESVFPVAVADESHETAFQSEIIKITPQKIRHWLPAQAGLFMERLSEYPNHLSKLLLRIGLPVLNYTPPYIYRGFQQVEVSSRLLCPTSVIDFLRQLESECKISYGGQLPSKLEDTSISTIEDLKELISYCRKDENFVSLLEGLPLLLTADGLLRCFDSSNPVFHSKFSDLVPHKSHLFIHPNFVYEIPLQTANQSTTPTSTASQPTTPTASQSTTSTKAGKFNASIVGKCAVTTVDKSADKLVLRSFTTKSLAAFMPDIFPRRMRDSTRHEPWSFPVRDVLSEKWFRRLWEFLEKNSQRGKGDALDPLREWPIIPTTCGKLVTVNNAKTVLDMKQSKTENAHGKKVRKILEKLICPSLNRAITVKQAAASPKAYSASPVIFSSFLSYSKSSTKTTTSTDVEDFDKPRVTDAYIAHPNSAMDVLQVLGYMMEYRFLNGENLSANEKREMLTFFQEDYENLERCDDILKSLPFHKAMDGTHFSLSQFHSYAIVPSDVYLTEIEKLQRHIDCLFLHPDVLPTLDSLYKCLGGTVECSGSEFYRKYILPSFNVFVRKSQFEYLTHIKDCVLPMLSIKARGTKEKRQEFLKHLRSTRCIPDSDGNQLHYPREFYDPRNEVFRIMFEDFPNKFPPPNFCGEEWLDFFAEIGLKKDVDEEQFLKFCREVERIANQSPEDKRNTEKSKVLVSYLLTRDNDDLRDDSFLSDVSEIKFIASEKVEPHLLSLHQQYQCDEETQQPPFVQFHNSVPWCHRHLVWTSAPILPASVEPDKTLFNSLRIKNEPSADTVITQLQQITCKLAEISKKEEALPQSTILHKVVNSIYTFLDDTKKCSEHEISDNCSEKCKTLGNRLENVPCVLVEDDTMLVTGKQLCLTGDFSHQLHPFLYIFPQTYGASMHFWIRLGATVSVTSLQLSNLLKAIKDRCKDNKLNPNYKQIACYAMGMLFQVAVNEHESKKTSDILYLTELCFPSKDMLLMKSSELVCKVPPTLRKIVSNLNYHVIFPIEKCGLSRSHLNKFLKILPNCLRPRPLTEILRETLDPSCLDKICELCKENCTCDFIRRYILILKSREFQKALVRMLKHQSPNYLTDEERKVLSRFRSAETKIKCMKSIKTHFVLTKTDEPQEKTSRDRVCWVTQTDNGWVLYLKHQVGGKNNEVIRAKCINRILEKCIQDSNCVLALTSILSCESPLHISGRLDELEIEEDVEEGDQEENRLGQKVPIVFHCLMQQNLSFVFHEGEIVGYAMPFMEIQDDYEEDIEVDELIEEEGEEDEKAKRESNTTYILAKVISQLSKESHDDEIHFNFTAQYRIDIGSEVKEVSVLDLYKFCQDGGEEMTDQMLLHLRNPLSTPVNMDEAKRKIREALREAKRLPLEDRRKVIRRLYLRWHPDKNPDNVELATEMTKFLSNEIEQMKEFSPFTDLFKECDKQATKESDIRQNFSDFHGETGFSSFDSSYYTNPDPDEARRWMTQSRSDLDAAEFLLSANGPFNALACFLSQQIAEKCLKAALYAKCGLQSDQLHSHDVRSLANAVSRLKNAPDQVVQLAVVVEPYYLKTRYPNQQPRDIVPANYFNGEQSAKAVQAAKELLTIVDLFIN